MTDLEALADVVRTTRKRKRMMQQELAEKAGVSLGVISNFERAKTRPQPGNERAILTVLGLETAEDDEHYDEERRDWPADVAVCLDVIGLFLMGKPEKARTDIIHDLTRWVMNHPSR